MSLPAENERNKALVRIAQALERIATCMEIKAVPRIPATKYCEKTGVRLTD